MFLHKNNNMAILLKTASVRVNSIQIMQVRVQNKGKSVLKSRYDKDVSEGGLLSVKVFGDLGTRLKCCVESSSDDGDSSSSGSDEEDSDSGDEGVERQDADSDLPRHPSLGHAPC